MLIVRSARGNGKSLMRMQMIQEAIENGKKVLVDEKDGLKIIDKNGVTAVDYRKPEQSNIQKIQELIMKDITISHMRYEELWRKVLSNDRQRKAD